MKHFESIHWPAEAAPEVFYKKRVFKNFAKFTGKHLCQSLFLKSTLKVCFIKKEAPAEVFFCEFHKVFKKAFLVEHLWLLLKVYLNENFAGLHS